MRALPGQRALAREELTELLEESIRETVSFDSHESMLLTNILGLRDITAMDVMVPRADIVSVDITDGHKTIFRTIIEANHSRVPVCKVSLDEVLGFLHIKDVARTMRQDTDNSDKPGDDNARDDNAGDNNAGDESNIEPDLMAMLRQPIFIAPTMRALDLLQEMRLKRLHLALVVDEYGGIDGLITIEDLVEEIVGEINDEHDDDAEPLMVTNTDGTITVEARVELDQLWDFAGIRFDDEEFEEIDTVGGLVATLAGRVPGRGEIIRHASGLEFEIIESHPRHISVIKIGGLERITTPGMRPATPSKKSAARSKKSA